MSEKCKVVAEMRMKPLLHYEMSERTTKKQPPTHRPLFQLLGAAFVQTQPPQNKAILSHNLTVSGWHEPCSAHRASLSVFVS